MKTDTDIIQDRDEEIARLEKLLLERHRSTYFRCPQCERVFPAVYAAGNLDLKTKCCTDPTCIRRTRFAERTAREVVGDDHLYDMEKEAEQYGKRPAEELRFLGYIIQRD